MTESIKGQTKVAEAYEAMHRFADALNALEGEEVLAEICRDAGAKFSPDVRLEMIFQLLTVNASGPENIGTRSRHDALDLAEKMGQDWCQWLYHFAVLCTKLA